MADGRLPAVKLNSMTAPLGVIRPTLSAENSVNQTLPSAPSVITDGFVEIPALKSVTEPDGVTRPMCGPTADPIQTLPSEPGVSEPGLSTLGTGKKLMEPVGVTRPSSEFSSVNQTLPSGPLAMLSGPV